MNEFKKGDRVLVEARIVPRAWGSRPGGLICDSTTNDPDDERVHPYPGVPVVDLLGHIELLEEYRDLLIRTHRGPEKFTDLWTEEKNLSLIQLEDALDAANKPPPSVEEFHPAEWDDTQLQQISSECSRELHRRQGERMGLSS